MPRKQDEDNPKAQFEIKSHRFGNDKTIEDAFETRSRPTPPELIDALAATDRLTEKEATAFVFGYFRGFPPRVFDTDRSSDVVENLGFETVSQYKSIHQEATNKIADILWICELIDAYRSPEFTKTCQECGQSLDGHGVRVSDAEDEAYQCLSCSEIDPDQL
jgi:hypothetical protein